MTAAVYTATMNTSFPPAPPPVTAPSPPQPVSLAQQPRYVEQISGQLTPPVSGSATPSTTSPTSPRTTWNLPPHLQPRVQQIRPPKSPMYVPAVLRPTEKPLRHSPPKDSSSIKYGSPESLGEGSTPVQTSAGPMPAGVSRIVTEEWNDEALGKVTGRPSRDHWKVRFFFAFSSSLRFHQQLFTISLRSNSLREICTDGDRRPCMRIFAIISRSCQWLSRMTVRRLQ
jgi:hypothetical protein